MERSTTGTNEARPAEPAAGHVRSRRRELSFLVVGVPMATFSTRTSATNGSMEVHNVVGSHVTNHYHGPVQIHYCAHIYFM